MSCNMGEDLYTLTSSSQALIFIFWSSSVVIAFNFFNTTDGIFDGRVAGPVFGVASGDTSNFGSEFGPITMGGRMRVWCGEGFGGREKDWAGEGEFGGAFSDNLSKSLV